MNEKKKSLHYRARVAALTRSRTADDVELLDARRALAAANLEEYVSRVIAEAPPLTDAQRDRIAALLGRAPGGFDTSALVEGFLDGVEGNR